jgi:hypothetical protein
MASVALLTGAGVFNTIAGTKTGTAVTPTANDLLIVVAAHTGNTASVAPTDDQGGTYSLVATASKVLSADTMTVWARDSAAAAVLTTFSHAPGTTTGGGFVVYGASGLTRAGAAAIRQAAVQSNTAAATPAPVFGVAALTTNPVLGVVFNGTNPATMTPRGSPAYAEGVDTGYNTPPTGLETMRINSGETATTITWGSASASEFAAVALELDASAVPRSRYYYDMSGQAAL